MSETRQLEAAVADLLPRAQAGDVAARDQLLRRCHGSEISQTVVGGQQRFHLRTKIEEIRAKGDSGTVFMRVVLRCGPSWCHQARRRPRTQSAVRRVGGFGRKEVLIVNTLPTKRGPAEPAPEETEDVPTWRELRDRVADVMKDLIREGKELERDLEPRILPALKTLKAQIEKLIARLEERASRRGGPTPEP